MTFSRPFCLIVVLMGYFISGSAQNNFQVRRFTTDNALPSNGIKGLQWDEETGFLWIATEAGITRYNGAGFVSFSRMNMPEFSSERMLFLLRNEEGRIFTSDENGTIFYVMQNKLQYMGKVSIDTRPSSFKLIGLAASGKLFRQSADHPAPGFGFNFSDGALIPLTETRLLLHQRDSLFNYREGNPAPSYLTTIGRGGRVFYMNGQLFGFEPATGFYRLSPDDPRKIPVSMAGADLPGSPALRSGLTIHLFWQYGMKAPLLIQGAHAWILQYKNGCLVPTEICDTVPTDALLSFGCYNEKRNLLFLGTASKGLIMISRNSIRSVKVPGAAAGKITSTYSQLPLPDGKILTSQGDILGGHPNSRIPIQGPFNNFVFTAPDSICWYSQGDSVYSWDPRKKNTAAVYAGKGSITDGFARSGEDLYIANAIGIGVLHEGKINYLYRHPQPDINSNVPFSMLELVPGQLVIACCNGLYRFDISTRRLDTLLHPQGCCVRALWKYKDYLFIGTYGKGIFVWKQGIVRQIPPDKNNYLLYAHCFVEDKLGYCWISTNNGLFRTRPSDMISAFEKDNNSVYYHYYGRNDGLDITELNGGCTPCAINLGDSVLSFPSMDGLVWVNPTEPLSQLPEGNLYIDAFYADNVRVNTASLVEPDLPPGTRELSFMLGYSSWVNRENIYIEYKLSAYSTSWQLLDIGDPVIHFSNLPSGDYQLMIRKLNGFGSNNYTQTEISFHIADHWYQQVWAWLLGICCLTAMIVWIVRLRTWQFQVRQRRLEAQIAEKTKELKQKNEELEKTDHIKTRLISIISHDLVTPLKFLHMAGKNLIEKKSQLTEDLQRETITEIMNTSKELELLSTNILNWIKYRNEDRRLARESFNLHQLVQQLFGLFNAMAKQKQIFLVNEVHEKIDLFQFIEPVKIVLYNLILNGINFSSEGSIRVSNTLTVNGIALIIEDTGVGMTQEQINNIMADHFIISSANVDRRKGNGLGYLIIKDLLKIIKGSLTIRSEKGKGTQVTVLLPLESALKDAFTP